MMNASELSQLSDEQYSKMVEDRHKRCRMLREEFFGVSDVSYFSVSSSEDALDDALAFKKVLEGKLSEVNQAIDALSKVA